MPLDEILVFRNVSGNVPLREWLSEIRIIDPRAYVKCLERIQNLELFGGQLHLPRAKILRDGIWELRAKRGKVHYRIMFFFCGKGVACLSHGFKKGG